MRNFNLESHPLNNKKYNYDFDSIVRAYMFRDWQPFFLNGAALEIGCYHGDSTIELCKYFSDLTVIEPSDECISITRNRVSSNVQFHLSTLENFESNKKFKNIFLVNTLEHSDDAVVMLKKAKQKLDHDGRIFILVPNADAPSRQIAVRMGLIETCNAVTEAEWIHGHRRTYSFDTLEKDIRMGGLRCLIRGGLIFKALANYQFDLALESGIISQEYVEGCYALGSIYPHLCASIYIIVELVKHE